MRAQRVCQSECSVIIVVIFTVYVPVILIFWFIVMIFLMVYGRTYAKNYILKSYVLTIFCVSVCSKLTDLYCTYSLNVFTRLTFVYLDEKFTKLAQKTSGMKKSIDYAYNILAVFHSNYLKWMLHWEKYFDTNFDINTTLEI